MKFAIALARMSLLLLAWASVAVFLSCGNGESEPRTPTATTSNPTTTVTSSATSTPTAAALSADQQVLAAYRRYWDVYTDALYTLDSSQLEQVMAGPRLARALDEIESLRRQGRAVRIVVRNDPLVAAVQTTEAVVIDQYQNESFVVDARTKEPVGGRGPAQSIRDTFTLTRVDGVWKVVDSIRQAGGQQ